MATQIQMDNPILSSDFQLRSARWSDLEGVAKLILDVCTADGDATIALAPEELAHEWKNEGFTLENDAWVVETTDGRIVGYEEFYNRHGHASLQGDGYVHPDFMGRGIGTSMLRRMDVRALREMELVEPGRRVYIRNGMAIGDQVGRELHEAEGYRPIRFSWRMEINLADAPPEPQWPEGISLRPFDLEERNRAVFEAHEEAFSDHWGHTPGSFSRWQTGMTGREDFDPSLWFIAWDGDRIAGYSLCRVRNDVARVGTLGVRRPWRKRGLGMALLLHSFGEFYRRGRRIIDLGVDAANPTGATRLYQKAGMKVAAEYVIYEKEYRPGFELQEEEAGNPGI
jgi:mycothiol synthase